MVVPRPDTLSASWGTMISSSAGMTTATTTMVASRLRTRAAFGDRPRLLPPPGEGRKSFFSKNDMGTFSTKATAPPISSGEATPPTNRRNARTWPKCCRPVNSSMAKAMRSISFLMAAREISMLVPPEPLCGGVYDCSILPRPAAFVNGQSVNFI